MSNQATPPSFLACIPHAIESHWDNVWAPRLAGFPVNIVYAARIEGLPKPRTFSIPVHLLKSSRPADAISPDNRKRLFGPGGAPLREQD